MTPTVRLAVIDAALSAVGAHDRLRLVHDRHALVIGCERAVKAQAEDRHLNAEEGNRLAQWQEHQQHDDIADQSGEYESGRRALERDRASAAEDRAHAPR